MKKYKQLNPVTKKRLLVGLFLFWTPVVAFSYIAGEVLERQPLFFDNAILQWIHAHSSTFLDKLFLAITTIGNVEVITLIALTIIGILLYKRYRLQAAIIFSSFFGAAAANFVLKLVFHRDRPAFWQSAIRETGYSFPSGHAMLSSALALSIIAIAWNTRWRWLAIGIGVPFILLIGYSRLYLGVHYPTDVLAGWLASSAWVIVVVSLILGYPAVRVKFTEFRIKS